jgi:hypothetical protein
MSSAAGNLADRRPLLRRQLRPRGHNPRQLAIDTVRGRFGRGAYSAALAELGTSCRFGKMRRIASAAAAKKWPRLFQCGALSASIRRK